MAQGKTMQEMEEAIRAICNASWGRFDHKEQLIKFGCLHAVLKVLVRVHPVYGDAHTQRWETLRAGVLSSHKESDGEGQSW